VADAEHPGYLGDVEQPLAGIPLASGEASRALQFAVAMDLHLSWRRRRRRSGSTISAAPAASNASDDHSRREIGTPVLFERRSPLPPTAFRGTRSGSIVTRDAGLVAD
jgi:hypothetical protein